MFLAWEKAIDNKIILKNEEPTGLAVDQIEKV
jgi:hypothetical protein